MFWLLHVEHLRDPSLLLIVDNIWLENAPDTFGEEKKQTKNTIWTILRLQRASISDRLKSGDKFRLGCCASPVWKREQDAYSFALGRQFEGKTTQLKSAAAASSLPAPWMGRPKSLRSCSGSAKSPAEKEKSHRIKRTKEEYQSCNTSAFISLFYHFCCGSLPQCTGSYHSW